MHVRNTFESLIGKVFELMSLDNKKIKYSNRPTFHKLKKIFIDIFANKIDSTFPFVIKKINTCEMLT